MAAQGWHLTTTIGKKEVKFNSNHDWFKPVKKDFKQNAVLPKLFHYQQELMQNPRISNLTQAQSDRINRARGRSYSMDWIWMEYSLNFSTVRKKKQVECHKSVNWQKEGF